MVRNIPLLAAIAFAAVSFALPASANDSTAVLEAGGLRLVRDAPVKIAEESLFISANQIVVDYRFRAVGTVGTTTLVAFPLPEYDLAWNGDGLLGGPGDSVQERTGFRLWVNGVETRANLELKAMRNGIDVSSVLTQANIDLGSLDYHHITSRLRTVSANVRQTLEQADVVRWLDPHTPEPLWTIKATYYWSQTFPPREDVLIRHSYQPVAGASFVSDPDLRDLNSAAFCMTASEKQGVRNRLAASANGAILASHVRYILTTGANWHGPIGTFNLAIDKGAPTSMVSLCFDGLQKKTPTRFETTIHDFVPQRELDILFLKDPAD